VRFSWEVCSNSASLEVYASFFSKLWNTSFAKTLAETPCYYGAESGRDKPRSEERLMSSFIRSLSAATTDCGGGGLIAVVCSSPLCKLRVTRQLPNNNAKFYCLVTVCAD
jgi:hypothetical protein